MIAPLLYRAGMAAAAPFLPAYLARRAAAGKEDPARLSERYGVASAPRPPGRLAWLHGASIGEALSLLPLIEALSRDHPDLSFLVTSGTVTSARLLAERLPPSARHQFLPLDAPAWVRRFLDHWRPDLGVFVESELWPQLIAEARRRGIPLALVNARLSARAETRWGRARGWATTLLGSFSLILAPDEDQAGRYRTIGARAVTVTGNLKSAAPPLPHDEAELARLRDALRERPVLLFASTHAGEETIAAALHRALAARHRDLLTIVAPRHPDRGGAIAAELGTLGFRVARRSAGAAPDGWTELYLADSLGEMGLLYRLADLVVMGGAFVPMGGHNPLEPAQLDRAILSGPGVANFADLYRRLEARGGCRRVADAAALGQAAGELLEDRHARARMAAAARGFAADEAAVLDRIMAALGPFAAQALARTAP